MQKFTTESPVIWYDFQEMLVRATVKHPGVTFSAQGR